MSRNLNIGIDRTNGVTANYLCNRLSEVFLRLNTLEPSNRAGLRPRLNINGKRSAAAAVPNVPFTSELFKRCRVERALEEMQKEETATPSASNP